MDFTGVLVMALLIESTVHNLRLIYDAEYRGEQTAKHQVVALGVAEVLCVLGKVDIYTPAGVPLDRFEVIFPWVGYIFTGILLQRGSGIVFDLIDKLKKVLNA